MQLISDKNKILHKPCSVIPEINKDFKELISKMFDLMKIHSGLGLAAPQVGLSQRFFIMSYGGQKIVCVDPKILEFSGDMILKEEGCLSYPNQYMSIRRPESIKVTYTDINNKVKKTKFKGMKARIFQHESDHLHGLTFFDRARADMV